MKIPTSDGSYEYEIPSISIIPPTDMGCYIDLNYNGNVLEDKFFISKERQTKSRDKNWQIINVHRFNRGGQHITGVYNRDHYMIFKATNEKDDKSSGKNLMNKDIRY